MAPLVPPPNRAIPRQIFPILLLLFLASGAAGLVYEVIWTRLLLNVFGATLYAVTTVLAAFMAGLALGSLLGGSAADRTRHPLRLYGVLEIVIAMAVLAVPLMLRAFDPLYRAVYAGAGASFLQLSLLRFALSFLVLLIPTTCMGATLPLLSRFIARRPQSLGSRIGTLYAVNTTGAVLGTFAAGFILIERLGVQGSVLAAAAVSASVGVVSLILSAMLEKAPAAPPAAEIPDSPLPEKPGPQSPSTPVWIARLVLVTYGLSGFIALAYQVFWSRTLVFRFDYLKNTTYSFSAMLTVFLAGLAVGSALMASRIDRERDPVRLYGLIQILTGLSGAFSLFMLIRYAGYLQLGEPLGPGPDDFNWILAVGNVFLRTVATIGLPTFLMGMAFPVAARICVGMRRGVGTGTGRLYAANTLGAILGAFAAGFILVPLFGLSRGILVLGIANIAIGLTVLFLNPAESARRRQAWAALAAVALVIFFVRLPREYCFQDIPPNHRLITYHEGPLATVSVVENSIGDRTIYVDNVGVAGTDRILLTDQKSLAHIPMLFLEKPRTALTVGFGSGGASWSYLLYPELERVDCVEICQTVLGAAHTLKASNYGILDEWNGGPIDKQTLRDGRYRLIIDDARAYLRFTRERYDIIATDCTDLRYKSNANLYDVEYFRLCREALTDDGMVVVWMPLGGMSPTVFACALATFADVFPDMTLWYMHNEPTHYLLLLGTRKPLQIHISRMLERVARPEIRRDLAEVSLHQPEKILACFLENAQALRPVLDPAPRNTEDHPYLEFESPKFGYGDAPLVNNLETLRQHRASVIPYLADAEAHPGFVNRLRRFEQAVDPILEGHRHIRRPDPDIPAAARAYLEALEIVPEDESLQFLLSFHDLRRREKRNPGDLWPVLALAQVDLLKKDFRAAANRYYRLIENTPGSSEQTRDLRSLAVLGLARSYLALGQTDRAARTLADHRADVRHPAEVQALEAEIRSATTTTPTSPSLQNNP